MWTETHGYQLSPEGRPCRFRILLAHGQIYLGRRSEPSHLVEIDATAVLAGVGRDNGPAVQYEASTGEVILVPAQLKPLIERHLQHRPGDSRTFPI